VESVSMISGASTGIGKFQKRQTAGIIQVKI
jgi:hypothetical protein